MNISIFKWRIFLTCICTLMSIHIYKLCTGIQFYFIHTSVYRPISIMVKVFANGPGDRGSIPGRVIPKTQKMVLDISLLNTQHYKVQIKGKWSNPRKELANSPTPWCSSYWKGSLLVTLDYSWPTYCLCVFVTNVAKGTSVSIYLSVCISHTHICVCV